MKAGDLELADLVDVELQLLRDRDSSGDDLRQRDRPIGRAIGASDDLPSRSRVLRDWIRRVGADEHRDSVGERVVRAYRALGWILTLLGLSSGVGAAAAVLAYDGKHPVNAVHFLAVFVGLQLILVSLFVFSASLWRLRDRLPVLDGVYGLLRLVVVWLVGRFERHLTAEQRSLLKAARGRMRSSQIIYGDVERWLLVSVAQRFGLWFNLGALATCMYLIAFSDLAFAWQTTLDWSAEGFHRAMAVLAAPWSWIYPDGLPSLELVRASRYFRLDGSFGGARAELLGEWWRFLVLCLVVYGLSPRVALTAIAHVRSRRALAALRLDHGEIASLIERLTAPLVETRAPERELEAPAAAKVTVAAAPARRMVGAQASVLIWGDIPIDAPEVEALIDRRFGWRVVAQARAGVEVEHRDATAIAAVTVAPPGGDERGPIVVLAEGFEAPTREARTFVQRLRAAAGVDRPIVVTLLDSDETGRFVSPLGDDLLLWKRHLAALGDPYLRVEALVPSPSEGT